MFEENLQTDAIKARQVEAKAFAASGFYSSVKPKPLVLVLYDPRRPEAERTPAPAVPALESKARFVKGEYPQPLAILACIV
jgi:hypothetical protein